MPCQSCRPISVALRAALIDTVMDPPYIDAAKMLALDSATRQPGEAIEKLVNDALAEPVSSSRGRCTRMHSLAQSICLTYLCIFIIWRNGYVELRPRIRR